MSDGPASPGPGRDEDPLGVPAGPDDDEAWQAWLAAGDVVDETEPPDFEEYPDPDGPPPGEDRLTAQELAEIAAASAAEAMASAFLPGHRGPGQPASARRTPGERSGPAASFASGFACDVALGSAGLAGLADRATGDGQDYAQVSDDELIGVLCAWDRVEAHAFARKLAAVAEFARRRPAPGCAPQGPARMPEAWDEFTDGELADALAESRVAAGALLGLATDLEIKLPGTQAALADGIITRVKAWIIYGATAHLDPEEARAAEALVLGRAGRLTPGGLRAAIARAVIEVAPDKARERREAAARDARVQRWREDSGNAALMGRELPPAEVLAADQRITGWAKQLKQAGLDGSMDELRARAYLDILLGKDSRPAPPATATRADPASTSPASSDPASSDPASANRASSDKPAGPVGPVGPAGFAAQINLTATLTTLLGQADRPAEIPGLGPVDPWLARDLLRDAAGNPATTWCLTITDQHGHAIGHGCARPEPSNRRKHRKKQGHPVPGGPDPPDPPAPPGSTGFTFTASSQHGPPGGYGTWRLTTGVPGRPALIFALDPIPTGACDHRYQASGHDPGVKLRHLTEIWHATCTAPTCRRPSRQCDFDHNIPYEADGRTCTCNGGPKCRYDHRRKQHPRWTVEQLPGGTFQWTAPSGRQYTTSPTVYPI